MQIEDANPKDDHASEADQITENDPHKVENLANIGKDSDSAQKAEEE